MSDSGDDEVLAGTGAGVGGTAGLAAAGAGAAGILYLQQWMGSMVY